MSLAEKKRSMLKSVMARYGKEDICLAFSGGVDSSLLLKIASDEAGINGTKVYAVTFDSRLHPPCEIETASRVAKELGAIHRIITVDELEQEEIRHNPVNRCYLCKRYLFQRLKKFADQKGIRIIMDGTNEDDMHVYRPGLQALKELEIISPLADLHITKAEVRQMAAGYGISVAFRSPGACMATRIPYHTDIDYDVLERIAKGEAFLRTLIDGNIRLRLHGDVVRIEVDSDVFFKIFEIKDKIIHGLKKLGFLYITLDLESFRSGSMDLKLKNRDCLKDKNL